MKRSLSRPSVHSRLQAADREMLEAGEIALKRSVVVLDRLEATLERAVNRQNSDR
ncbi:hypothetical protein [Kaistia adipata]|uniref:hypothetical protein n=1 Tax=Kaistia adipata TaxID=166954 RepID=UPI0003FAA4F9|nr:hypothetical protein [Kaistia adipata]